MDHALTSYIAMLQVAQVLAWERHAYQVPMLRRLGRRRAQQNKV
jgi:hypothetical protein